MNIKDYTVTIIVSKESPTTGKTCEHAIDLDLNLLDKPFFQGYVYNHIYNMLQSIRMAEEADL